MKKRAFLAVLVSLCLAICLIFTACDSGEKNSSKDDDDETEKTEESGEFGGGESSKDVTSSSNGTTDTSAGTTDTSMGATDSSNQGVVDKPCTEHKGGVATCTKKAECEACGVEYGELAPHTEEIIPAVDATCTETGLTAGKKCSVCGVTTVEQTVVEALGHEYNNGNACIRCGKLKEAEASEGLECELSSDRTYYVVAGIGTCEDTDLVIPSEYNGLPVKEIGYEAFSYCRSLTSVVIPEGVTSIGDYAFAVCISLTSVVIPESVTSIGSSAFSNCTNLTIYCEAKSEPSGWHYDWNESSCPVVWGHAHSYTDGECICGVKEK